jgi:excisionase family DNA binding protein
MLPALKKLIDDGNAIRPEKLAGVLGVALPTIHSWVRRGVIPHYKIERATLFNPVELAEWWKMRHHAAEKRLVGYGQNGAPD